MCPQGGVCFDKENKCFVLMLIEGEKEKGSGWVCPVTSGCVLRTDRTDSQHPRVRRLIMGNDNISLD